MDNKTKKTIANFYLTQTTKPTHFYFLKFCGTLNSDNKSTFLMEGVKIIKLYLVLGSYHANGSYFFV